jgi:nucleoid-associated protein YgaU
MVITRAPVVTSTDPLGQAAQQHGEQLVYTDGTPVQQQQATAPTPTAGEYVAQPGDTLSKMAGRLMGENTKANRDAIVRANPSLKDDPNKIIAGKKYMIPLRGGASAPSPAASVAEAPKPQQEPSSQPEYWYTVKEGDNLWKIAESQFGDGNAYTAIKELNKDTLKGGDTVTPNMKLRLPARPIASAAE